MQLKLERYIFYIFTALFLPIFYCYIANAAMQTINIESSKRNIIKLHISYFETFGKVSADVINDLQQIIFKDLKSSDRFNIFTSEIQPNEYERLFGRGLQYGIQGKVSIKEDNSYSIVVAIYDLATGSMLVEKKYSVTQTGIRKVSHLIANFILFFLTGEEGYFDSKILYVGSYRKDRQSLRRLAVIDQDGYNNQFLTNEGLQMSPSYVDLLKKIFFVNFKTGIPQINVIDVHTGVINDISFLYGELKNKKIMSPRVSPDGSYMVFSVLEGNDANIYKFLIEQRVLKKLTNSGLNVSSSISPDSKYIAYSSNVEGKPNLYVMTAGGWNPQRISYGLGFYNEPTWSPDGQWIAFTRIAKNVFHIGIMKPDGSDEKILFSNYLAESPTWSFNSQQIAFISQKKSDQNSRIEIINLEGKKIRAINFQYGVSDLEWILVR